MNVSVGVSLAEHTTLGVGGPAAHWCEARSREQILQALAWADERGLPTVVLGGGSNVLVADRGIEGLVLRVRNEAIDATTHEDRARVTVAAGTNWDALVRWSVAEGYAGLECLSGIPGEVGAAPMQNIGAYGQEVGQVIRRVELMSRADGQTVEFAQAACEFGYRDSVFKTKLADRYVVVGVEFELTRCRPTIAYAELARALANEAEPTVAHVRDTVLSLRRAKSMLLDAHDANGKSAGSFFVNPTLSPEQAQAVEVRALSRGVDAPMPRFSHGSQVKLSAAWLIERAGFAKGTRSGEVGLSTKHSLAVVNHGRATAADIVAFATDVRNRVRDAFGISLSPEPRPMGFYPEELVGLYD